MGDCADDMEMRIHTAVYYNNSTDMHTMDLNEHFSDISSTYYTLCLKKCTNLLDTMSKCASFSVSGLKVEKLIKKQTYMKTEACKLYSRVF